MTFMKFFWITLVALFIISLFACENAVPVAPAPCASLAKISATDTGFKEGHYISDPINVPLETVSRMKMIVRDTLIHLYTVTGRDTKAHPATGVDSLMPYSLANNMLWVGSFNANVRLADSVTLILTWMSRDFHLKWYLPLQVPTGIRPENEVKPRRTCLE